MAREILLWMKVVRKIGGMAKLDSHILHLSPRFKKDNKKETERWTFLRTKNEVSLQKKHGNLVLAQKLLFFLLQEVKVRAFCVCAGARNSPLLFLLQELSSLNPKVLLWSFVDERAAAFFALGHLKSEKAPWTKPVALLCTSGTAASAFFPAIIEARMTALPLLVLTADRPSSYREAGTPQTIYQDNLYGRYTLPTLHLENQEGQKKEKEIQKKALWKKRMESLQKWKRNQPFHINISFTDDLLGPPLERESFQQLLHPLVEASLTSLSPLEAEEQATNLFSLPAESLDQNVKILTHFLQKHQKHLFVLLGEIPWDQRQRVLSFLSALKRPFYASSLSHLRGEWKLKTYAIQYQNTLYQMLQEKHFKALLRIGGIPPLRFWRDLEKQKHLAILSLSFHGFKGLAQAPSIQLPFSTLCPFLAKQETKPNQGVSQSRSFLSSLGPSGHSNAPRSSIFSVFQRLASREKTLEAQIEKNLQENPQSEGALIHAFSQSLPSEDALYLGNSLPLRYWDWLAVKGGKGLRCANRGVNGIDGQLSTFLGWAEGLFQKEINKGFRAWCLLGDLTTIYDLNALWILPQLSYAHRMGILIVNNGGGRIFDFLPFFKKEKKKTLFIQPHDLHFAFWAKMWGCSYQLWDHVEKVKTDMAEKVRIPPSSGGPLIRELCPQSQGTKTFLASYKNRDWL